MWDNGGVEPTAITPTSLELMINLCVFRLKLLVCILTPVSFAIKKLAKSLPPNRVRLSGSTTKEPDDNNIEDAEICPFDFKIIFSFDEFIWVSLTSNPPIEADTNLAKPLDVIEDEALATVDG